MTRRSAPESLVERTLSAPRLLLDVHARDQPGDVHLANPLLEQSQRIEPERVDLDRLSTPRCDDPVVHLRIHPGQLVARFPLAQQAVGGIYADPEPRAGHVTTDDIGERG